MGVPVSPVPAATEVTAVPFEALVTWPWAFKVTVGFEYVPGETPVAEMATVPVIMIGFGVSVIPVLWVSTWTVPDPEPTRGRLTTPLE